MVSLVLSPENPNRPSSATDAHFAENGPWEKSGGRRQSRSFARAFVDSVKIPLKGPFSFLDLGCALGDSIPIVHAAYPQAQLYGCDVSANAVRRCNAEHGGIANFFQTSIHQMDREFDVIFCSNLIEHIENHVEMVDYLRGLAKILYVMTPYMELNNGQRLTPKMGMWHVATFDEHTFDSLRSDGVRIKTSVLKLPSSALRPFYKVPFAIARDFVLNRTDAVGTQIVYEIENVDRI